MNSRCFESFDDFFCSGHGTFLIQRNCYSRSFVSPFVRQVNFTLLTSDYGAARCVKRRSERLCLRKTESVLWITLSQMIHELFCTTAVKYRKISFHLSALVLFGVAQICGFRKKLIECVRGFIPMV